MDSTDTNSHYTEPVTEQMPPDESELSHTDKMIGVLTEPKATYGNISKYPPKTIDWFLPVLLLLIVLVLTSIMMMNDPEIRFQAMEKQTEQIKKSLDEAVEKGQMTREQADQQMEQIQDRMDQMGPGTTMVISSVGILIGGFIFFFIMTAIYFLFSRFVFKDNGTYASALVANGLTAYIIIIQSVIAAILAMAFGRLINDTSAAALMNADRTTYTGWLLAKIDPISIWAYVVLAIGLANMFRSNSPKKYYALVFGIWIIGGFIVFYLAKVLPFLRMFGM